MGLTWASRAHDVKGTFFIIFKCFFRFRHANACASMRLLVKIHNRLNNLELVVDVHSSEPTDNIYCFIVYYGPLHFYNCNIKKGPTITDSASYSRDSCPFSIVNAFPKYVTVVKSHIHNNILSMTSIDRCQVFWVFLYHSFPTFVDLLAQYASPHCAYGRVEHTACLIYSYFAS